MNCKPGDLAVCIAADNLGGFVRVIRATRSDERWISEEWLCESLSSMLSLITGEISPPGAKGVMYDADLRPIRPGDISDEEVRDLYAPKVPEAATQE